MIIILNIVSFSHTPLRFREFACSFRFQMARPNHFYFYSFQNNIIFRRRKKITEEEKGRNRAWLWIQISFSFDHEIMQKRNPQVLQEIHFCLWSCGHVCFDDTPYWVMAMVLGFPLRFASSVISLLDWFCYRSKTFQFLVLSLFPFSQRKGRQDDSVDKSARSKGWWV